MAPMARNLPQNEKKTFDDFPNLKKMLPPRHDYYFESYNECESLEGEERFTASFRIDQSMATKEKVRQWIEEFCSHSLTTYRIDRTYPSETTWFVYRVDLRCQHNTKPTSHKRVQTPHKKHTGCPAKMIVKIRQARLSKRKRHETHLKTHPVEVILYHQHNHPILKANALKYRDPDSSLIEKFCKMYQAGYKPSAALEIHKRDLRLEYEDRFGSVVDDRGLCPDINWCYRQFDMFSRTCIEDVAGISHLQIQSLQQYVCQYNNKCGERCAAMKLLNDPNGNVVVALLSPLMRNAHLELRCSAKFIFIDSLEIEYLRCKVYMIMTHNGSCRVPLGTLITSSDSASVLREALGLYAELLPDRGFCGQGRSGPSVILVEDDDIQRSVMTQVFPNSLLFLSPYHIVQRAWAYLLESHNNFTYGHQVEVFEIFKNITCCDSEVDFENSFEKLRLIVAESPSSHFFSYIQSLYDRKHEWAACFLKNLVSDDSVEIVKNCLSSVQERFLGNIKSCTLIELLDFLANDMEEFYKQRLCKYVEGEYSHMLSLLYSKDKKVADALEVVPYFKVRNVLNGLSYNVDMRLGLCSCPIGKNGNPCQHQYALIQGLDLGPVLHQSHWVRDEELTKIIKNINGGFENSDNASVKGVCVADVSTSSVKPDVQVSFGGFQGDRTTAENKDCDDNDVAANTNTTTNEDVEMSDALFSIVRTDSDVQMSSEKILIVESDNRVGMNENRDNISESHTNQHYPCRICSKTLLSASQLVRHQKLHNHNKPVVCDICGLGYKSKECLKNHYARNHSTRKIFECEICGKKFKRLGSIAQHRKEHNIRTLKRPNRNEVFSLDDLPNHLNNEHTEGPPNIILEVKDQMSSPLQRQEIKEIIIIDTEGQLPFHVEGLG